MSVFQHLDDPLPLPDLNHEQRAAVIARGQDLERRRRVRLIGVPVAAAAVVASAAVALAVAPEPPGIEVLAPAARGTAAPAPPYLELEGPEQTSDPAHFLCEEAAGDGLGDPDFASFGLDRPAYPLFHYALVVGEMPSTGLVELRIEATSADGRRSRELVQRIVDGKVVEQYLRDPSTGARRDVPRTKRPYGDPGDHGGGGADFPGGSLSGLGHGWTWTASLSVNGAVVDSCDAGPGP